MVPLPATVLTIPQPFNLLESPPLLSLPPATALKLPNRLPEALFELPWIVPYSITPRPPFNRVARHVSIPWATLAPPNVLFPATLEFYTDRQTPPGEKPCMIELKQAHRACGPTIILSPLLWALEHGLNRTLFDSLFIALVQWTFGCKATRRKECDSFNIGTRNNLPWHP